MFIESTVKDHRRTADRVPAPPRSYLGYSMALFVVLLAIGVVMAVGMQSTVRYVETFAVDVAGKGLAQSAATLAESLDRALFEHALEGQTIAQAILVFHSDIDRLSTHLRTLKTVMPDYMNVQVVDSKGRVIASTISSQVGTDAGQKPWFQALHQRVGMDLSERNLFDSQSRSMIFYTPLIGEEGQFFGAVVLQVGFQSLEFLLDASKRSSLLQPSTGRVEYQLIAHDGTLLYGSVDTGKVMKRVSALSPSINGTVKPGYREEFDSYRNLALVSGYAPVNRYGQVPGWHWTVLIRLDRDSILASFHRFVAMAMMWVGLGLVILIGTLFWLIGRLKRASQRMLVHSAPRVPQSVAETAAQPFFQRTQNTQAAAPEIPSPEVSKGDSSPSSRKDQSPVQIKPPALDPAQWESLRRWVRLAEVNRVCLFKNHRGEDNEPWVSRRYEWIGLGEVARSEWSQWFSWSLRAKGFTRWEHQLSQGHTISGAVSTFPSAESEALASCDIHTVLVVPLMISGQWWGFIEFDHCFTDHLWSDEEQQGLQAVGNLLQSVIQFGSGEETLSQALAIMDAVLESTADGLLVVDEDGALITFNQRLVSMWKMPDAVTESRLTEEMMGWMMRQLKVPNVLLCTMNELGGEPDAESYDILELQDGRLVERFSKPRQQGDQSHGRIWIFRESSAPKSSTSSVHLSQ